VALSPFNKINEKDNIKEINIDLVMWTSQWLEVVFHHKDNVVFMQHTLRDMYLV